MCRPSGTIGPAQRPAHYDSISDKTRVVVHRFLSTCRSTGGALLNGKLPVFTSSFDHSEPFSILCSHIHADLRGCHIAASGLQRLALQMTPSWNQQPLYYLNDSFPHVIYSVHCRGLLKTLTAASSQFFRAPVRAQTLAVPQLSISCRKKMDVFFRS